MYMVPVQVCKFCFSVYCLYICFMLAYRALKEGNGGDKAGMGKEV